jgi:hypothetical protein
LLEEAEGEELIEERAIELLRPVVVEVGQGLEAAEASVTEPALEAALLALTVFDLEHALEPGLMQDLFGVGEEPVEVQSAQP